MAEVRVITTEVGKNNKAIVIGTESTGADGAIVIGAGSSGSGGAISLGANAGRRATGSADTPDALGQNCIDIRTAQNGIFLGNSGSSDAFGEANADYAVFKVGGTETVLTAAQFHAMLEAAKPTPAPVPDGSAEHPYLISSYADLEQLRQDVADGSEKRSAHYLQTCDIDMGNVAWDGIGLKGSGSTPSTGHSFEGTYDGGGHAIRNLTFRHSSSSKYIGFFHAAMGATIKNLTIDVNGFANLAADAADVSGAAFVGLCSDGLTMINCTANGNLGSEARPLNGNSAGVIAYVNSSTLSAGKSTVYLENVTNNVNVYCTRKTGGIVAFMVENLTMKNVRNNGTVSRISSDTGDAVGAMVAFSNGGGATQHTEYRLENIVNTGVVKASTSSKFYGQMFGQWSMNNGGGNYNTGYTTLVYNENSLPLAANWDPNIPNTFDIWFGEVRDDGLCHTVGELANGATYVYLFKNVDNSGNAYTPPAYQLPSGYTVTIDCRFDKPNIVDANGTAITGTQVGSTTKYTYTAP